MNSSKWLRRVTALALPVCVAAVPALASPSPAPQEKAAQETKEAARESGNAIKDSWVTMKVHSQFVPDDALEGSDIDVTTRAGVVTLTGTVATEAGRTRAVAIAKGTDGVKTVTDRLKVAPYMAEGRNAGTRAGAEAREEAREAKQETKEAAREAKQETREAAREAKEETREAARDTKQSANEATGTTGMAISDGWLKSKIAAQYVTEDALDNSDINININKGVVSLSGAVRTDAAKERAASIAKATDGVKSVKNNLKVNPAVK
jgi:hyperosmotically inducible protein